MPWLLDNATFEALSNANPASVSAQEADYEARLDSENEGGSRILAVAGSTARIEISGVLTPRPSWFARYFGNGNTTYPEIVSAIAQAEADPGVSKIEYAVNSPGGSIDGLFEAIEAAKAAAKPSRTVVHGLMASAAYMFGSQADSIVAINKASRIGSIGVMATLRKRGEEIIVTSSNAPKKAPDPDTVEGQAVIRQELDGLERIFVDAIAEGRNTTVQKVNADFGQGATLLAGEALTSGMIDSIDGSPVKTKTKQVKSASSAAKPVMDIETLKAENPGLYAQIVGLGVTQGVTQERERVSAHLTLGDASGDMQTALKAVEEGNECTALFQAKYQAAGMKRTALAARVTDADNIDADADGGDKQPAKDAGDALFEAFDAHAGQPILEA
jgi:ClpP class serine protease